MTKKNPSYHSTQKEQEEGRNEGEGEKESSAGSKSPTVAEDLEELRRKVKIIEGQARVPSGSRIMAKGCPFSSAIVRQPLPAHFKSAIVKDHD